MKLKKECSVSGAWGPECQSGIIILITKCTRNQTTTTSNIQKLSISNCLRKYYLIQRILMFCLELYVKQLPLANFFHCNFTSSLVFLLTTFWLRPTKKKSFLFLNNIVVPSKSYIELWREINDLGKFVFVCNTTIYCYS